MKACPIVLRNKNGHLEILILEHPKAGFQLAKGTIEKGESIKEACERELFEESGIVAVANKNLGTWTPGYHGQVWGFYLMDYVNILPESWAHDTPDDGGLTFKFSWRRLDYTPLKNLTGTLFLSMRLRKFATGSLIPYKLNSPSILM